MGRLSEEFFERNVFEVRVWAGLGQDLLRSLTLNGEVDRESHLLVSSGPPLAKAWAEILGRWWVDLGLEGPSWTAECEHGM